MKIRNKLSKKLFDFVLALIGLIVLSPLLIIITIAIWFQDFKSPFYISDRVGKNEKIFKIIKLRSMVMGADKKGIDSTSVNDTRITRVGKIVRKYKLDEISQLVNVLKGDMSLVGPRPNVKRETDIYTKEEKKLLEVKPGITDFASIVFADEGVILANQSDPDIAYNQLIRPGKSKLGLFYVKNQNQLIGYEI
jgi:lipopolysaccharide/colanic/teichoic acid biosynthesis glycosyltransferase